MYVASGRLITSRRPDNAIGWLLGSIGLSVATSMVAEQYALYGVATAPGAVPAAKAVGCLASVGAFATVLLLFLIVLLFPDGNLPSPRWRPVLWATAVVFIGWGTQQFQAGTTVTGGLTNALEAGGATYLNPVGFLPRHGWYSDLLTVIFVLAVLTAIAVVASVFARRRGASPERRQQLAWLGYVGALTVTWILSLGLATWLVPSPSNGWLGTLLWGLVVLTPVVGIPLACVVAILKYRLYDLGRVVSRTVTYAIVTSLLIGVYAGETARGFDAEAALESTPKMFRGGEADLELVESYASGDLAVLVAIERQHGEVGGLPDQDWSLRVTLVFRAEGSEWRLVHRHADPLVHAISMEHMAVLARGQT
jgi:hypothetical protein